MLFKTLINTEFSGAKSKAAMGSNNQTWETGDKGQGEGARGEKKLIYLK
jgi:hypothetical protein